MLTNTFTSLHWDFITSRKRKEVRLMFYKCWPKRPLFTADKIAIVLIIAAISYLATNRIF
jgi:hypothetical protein